MRLKTPLDFRELGFAHGSKFKPPVSSSVSYMLGWDAALEEQHAKLCPRKMTTADLQRLRVARTRRNASLPPALGVNPAAEVINGTGSGGDEIDQLTEAIRAINGRYQGVRTCPCTCNTCSVRGVHTNESHENESI